MLECPLDCLQYYCMRSSNSFNILFLKYHGYHQYWYIPTSLLNIFYINLTKISAYQILDSAQATLIWINVLNSHKTTNKNKQEII